MITHYCMHHIKTLDKCTSYLEVEHRKQAAGGSQYLYPGFKSELPN